MAERVNGEQLRADIDSGRTGDKVDHPDPAAAPLGTDSEAGGEATSFPSERRDGLRERKSFLGWWIYIAFILAVAVAALVLIWLAMRSR